MPLRHPPELVAEVIQQRRQGRSRHHVAREYGIPPATVRTWERRGLPRAAQAILDGTMCSRCGGAHAVPPVSDYAYLLGVYLGDGYLVGHARTHALHVALDRSYPAIITEIGAAIELVRGRRPATRQDPNRHMVLVTSYWNAWPCLFPQHGVGRKHQRDVTLEPWQRAIAKDHPGRVLRGLIHTDGWRGENRVRAKGRDYSYPRYQFSSRSDDIRDIFCTACEDLGIAWRPWGRWHISVARRDAVAILDRHVGPKR